jgi:hypothetical protein
MHPRNEDRSLKTARPFHGSDRIDRTKVLFSLTARKCPCSFASPVVALCLSIHLFHDLCYCLQNYLRT